MLKRFILIIFIFTNVLFSLYAQEHAAKPRRRAVNDSLLKVRKEQMKQWEAEKQKQQTIAREKFLQELTNLDPDSVTKLNMRNLGLTKMPDISRFYRLKKIDASGNRIKYFRKRDFGSDSLKTVVLSDNPVNWICFPKNSGIEHVVMDNCNLKRIFCSVRKLKDIKTVEFTQNRIKRVRRFIEKRSSLKEVNLNFNSIIFNSKVVKRLGKVERVLLAGNKISKLPEDIDRMTGVRKLNLADNRLREVPGSFGRLDSLESIVFYKNGFSQIPDEIFQLSNLMEMDFYYNTISVIPDEISKLQNLIRIYLSFNQIESIPGSISKLKKLKFLYIHHNKLALIPDWITTLPGLTVLDVGYNHLIEIPDLSKIINLEEVDIQNNNLEEIPWDLLVKPGIKRVYLRDNPFIEDGGELDALKKLVEKQSKKGVEIFIN
jgi:Leucine-rich repeat (LRR) protein